MLFQATILHCKALLCRGQSGLMRWILVWSMSQMLNRSLDLLICAAAAPRIHNNERALPVLDRSNKHQESHMTSYPSNLSNHCLVTLHRSKTQWTKKETFQASFCTVQLHWAGDTLGKWDDHWYEQSPSCRIDQSTCWPAVPCYTTVLRLLPKWSLKDTLIMLWFTLFMKILTLNQYQKNIMILLQP